MPALFPRWSNSLFALGIGVLVAVIVAVPVGLMVFARTPYVTGQFRPIPQPVSFDHRHHVDDDGIDCRYCHDLVSRSPSAGVPPTERCLHCHSQIWNESPLLEAVWRSDAADEPIPWLRVHRLPDFVYFDHSAHVNNGVGCVTCHGRVDTMARVYQSAPLTMQWCLGCHRNPAPNLRPLEYITTMRLPPEAELPPGEELVSRLGVAPGTSCTTCHR